MTKGRLVIRSSQRPPVSFRIDLRVVTVLLALGLVTLAGMFLNIGYGEYPVAPLDVARTVVGMDVGDGSYHFIVNTLRLPRVLVAFMVGAGMAISGAILQGLTHNALAAPEIIGVSAGAGLATVTLIVALPSVSTATLPPAAFVGALELPPIGWQLFILGGSQSDSTPFPSLLDIYATRLLAEPLSRRGVPLRARVEGA